MQTCRPLRLQASSVGMDMIKAASSNGGAVLLPCNAEHVEARRVVAISDWQQASHPHPGLIVVPCSSLKIESQNLRLMAAPIVTELELQS